MMGAPVIRPIHPNDALDMQETRTRPNAMWGTMQIPTLPLEDVQAWCNHSPNGYTFVAEVDGKAVGSLGLVVGQNRQRHLAGLGMMVHDDYQGRGLGKGLMAAALDLADNWLGLERVELEVYTNNPRAIQLYRNFGFTLEGTSHKMSLQNGEWVDAYYMGRLRGRAAESASGPAVLPAGLHIDATVPGVTTTPVPAPPPRQPLPAPLTFRAVRADDAYALHRLFLQPGVMQGLNRHPALQEDEVRQELSRGIPRTEHKVVAELGSRVVGGRSPAPALWPAGQRRENRPARGGPGVAAARRGRGVALLPGRPGR